MKKLNMLFATLILCSLMSGCSYYYNIDKKFISDGDFKYYYIEDEDCYAIVGGCKKTYHSNNGFVAIV